MQRKQDQLWAIKARDWLEIQEPKSISLWRTALDLGSVGSGTRVLDAGCGTGGASLLAQERGAIVSGCDSAEALLTIARERLPEADLKIGDLEALPFPDQTFDCVLAINSLQFASDTVSAAQELVRVTAPGGRVVVVVWSSEHCDQRSVYDAIVALFEKPPKHRGVFNLSEAGEVEALFPGLSFKARQIDFEFVYPNLEIALRGQMAAGPSQRVVEIFGKDKVETAVRAALQPFVTGSGEVNMQNRLRCVLVSLSRPAGATSTEPV